MSYETQDLNRTTEGAHPHLTNGPAPDARLVDYLRANYEGVFDDAQLERHLHDYIGFEIARQQVDWVAQSATNTTRVLDVGAGFGSFVLCARQRGLDAIGIEI